MKKLILTFLILIVFLAAPAESSVNIIFKNLVNKVPKEVFDCSLERISHTGLKRLLKDGENHCWKITFRGEEKIVAVCKNYSSKVTLFLLKPSALGVYTQNERARNFTVWKEVDGYSKLKKREILPVVKAEYFFDKEKRFRDISRFDQNVYFSFSRKTNLVKVCLNTWMVYEFERRPVDYKIWLEWTGESFEVKKERL